MLCDFCHISNKNLKAAIISGKYGNYCGSCFERIRRPPNSGASQYARDRDYETHQADVLQPWDSKGNPSKDFMRLYPDEAKDMFTKEEFERYG